VSFLSVNTAVIYIPQFLHFSHVADYSRSSLILFVFYWIYKNLRKTGWDIMNGSTNFDDIIKNAYIDTYFQPVANLSTGNIIGYEALSRGPRGTDLYMPNALIAEAKSHNRMSELDHLLRKMALVNASKRGLRKLLFINIDPVALYDDSPSENTVRRCADFGISPQHVVVEISERSAVCSFERFQKVISTYKSDGFSVACDDINCSLSNINAMSSLNPDFVKVDRQFVRGIDQNTNVNKSAELSSVISIAKMINAKVIAVGVETPGELSSLYRIGVDAAQGNLIGEPRKEFSGISQNTSKLIADLSLSNGM
jgi:EAL domain-containing protein (putative c-di-GMP-specific phosphodiesterase class I)